MKTIMIGGYGPGISDAVARKFASEGYQVALVARSKDKLQAAAKNLSALGPRVEAFPCDLSAPEDIEKLIEDVRSGLGPITVLHWNAYAGLAGDVTTARPAELRKVFDVGVTGLLAAVQAALPDLRSQKDAAVLVTGGGFALYDDKVDKMIVEYKAMGLGVVKAAQHKLVGILRHKLGAEGIYVGEVVVLGLVKGTAFDSGNATLDASTVADKFWELYQARSETSANVR
jgi:NADP-dependent 3-hydroxy acid dehydrogenase YdfG